jgi:uncharacterized protein (TIGR02677 family)
VYKDRFTQYLQNFVIGLQRSAQKMENLFKGSNPELEAGLFQRLTDYQLSIPRLGEEKGPQEYFEDFQESFLVMREWFMGTNYRESELSVLSKETVDTIRRITKFAQRLAEQRQVSRSRKAEYLHLAHWFSQVNTKNEADCLSAIVFGPAGGRHFYAESREMEDMNSHIEEEPPTRLELKPRVSTYRERQRQVPIRDHGQAKSAVRQAYLDEQRKLVETINDLASPFIPECTATTDNYYIKTGSYLEICDLEQINNIVLANYDKGVAEIKFATEELYHESIDYLITQGNFYNVASLSGLSLRYMQNDEGHILTIYF